MSNAQPGILAPVPKLARYLTFSLKAGTRPQKALRALIEIADGKESVIGIGQPFASALGRRIAGLRAFPTFFGSGLVLPSTPAALWCWLRGSDPGALYHRSRQIVGALSPVFYSETVIDGFKFDTGRDLTGYVDGTENPKGQKAFQTAIVQGQGAGLDGSSFVAVQRWVHDWERFAAMSAREQDNSIGRRKHDNKELAEAPPSAHVKRTAQESFAPEAFVLRRSMPWSDGMSAGLNFVAFGRSLDAFESQLRRMAGAEDGIADALFKFTRPVSGSYFWCPPMRNGKLNLSALGL